MQCLLVNYNIINTTIQCDVVISVKKYHYKRIVL